MDFKSFLLMFKCLLFEIRVAFAYFLGFLPARAHQDETEPSEGYP